MTHSYQDKHDAFVKAAPAGHTYAIADANGALTVTPTDGSDIAGSNSAAAAAVKKAAEAAGLEQIGTTGNFRPVGKVINSAGTGLTNADAATDEASASDRKRGSEKSSVKTTPFTIGLSRSLGGGASIHLEHNNVDSDTKKNQTALILKVDF